MIRTATVAFLTALAVSCLVEVASASDPKAQTNPYPMLGQLELRDRKVILTVVPDGYLYSVTDDTGAGLNADLTEDQLAEQYPDLLELLRPAIADSGAEIMMLAPVMN